MSMQTDILASRARTDDGQLLDQAGNTIGRCRVRSIYIVPDSSAGSVVFRDGGATGTIVFQYSIPSNPNMNSFSIQFPGDGIRCSTDAYVTFSVGSVTCLSVFYG